ncbi:hypothetical protein DIURU_003370 [Diutina rugosa]|uniref:ABC transporter domain-containing protein n=1 Tax=Diutina rugosa TaxID=5481 RepID=A0A642UKS2_DIURU|nr:uncharacterized protein DIURU_003370 [Diutina rugosa]KAA8901000.1 hypothetical protein DIURU_003370 [Diutina rugosa]
MALSDKQGQDSSSASGMTSEDWRQSEKECRSKLCALDSKSHDLANLLQVIKESYGSNARSSTVSMRDFRLSLKRRPFKRKSTITDLFIFPLTLTQFLQELKSPWYRVLYRIDFIAHPNEMVLVLGRPGSGCTSLLKAIAANDIDSFTKVEGDLRYGDLTQHQAIKSPDHDMIYCSDKDIHFPSLTVEQTLKFAISCKTPALFRGWRLQRDYINKMTVMFAQILGLSDAIHQRVGDAAHPGLSIYQKRRLTVGEALACRGNLYCWDNATRGLDASYLGEFTDTVRQWTTSLGTTSFVTENSLPNSVYSHYDKVIVMYHGRQIYYGPTSEAKAYFERMGYVSAPDQQISDFLTSVTSRLSRKKNPDIKRYIPESADEMEKWWQDSDEFKALQDELHSFCQPLENQPREGKWYNRYDHNHFHSHFTVSYPIQVWLCIIRAFQRLRGDFMYQSINVILGSIQGVLNGSMLWDVPQSAAAASPRGGVSFFALLFTTLSCLSDVGFSFANREVIDKQKSYGMAHSSADAIAMFVQLIPVSAIACITFVIPLYFLSDMRREAGPFFILFLFVYMAQLSTITLFRAVGALNRSLLITQSLAGFLAMITLVYSSSLVARPYMPVWFRWISYVNPTFYAYESALSTEFHNRGMECGGPRLIPSGPGYETTFPGGQGCAAPGSSLGETMVQGDVYLKMVYTFSYSHVWRNLGFMIAYISFNLFVNIMGLEFVAPIRRLNHKLIYLRGKLPKELKYVEKSTARDIECRPDDVLPTLDDDWAPPSCTKMFSYFENENVFAWKNLSLQVKKKVDGQKHSTTQLLLDDVFGYIEHGKMTAIMGESGSGKSLLLKTLAHRRDVGVLTGEMLINGAPLDSSFRRQTGYVSQENLFLATDTVRETLYLSACLRRPSSVSEKEKKDYCDEIIRMMEIDAYADAVIGKNASGLTIKQQKQLAIAIELVAKPSLIMFLDEPTSKLDYQSSFAILTMLRDLASAGQMVLCTVHKPPGLLLDMFDRVLLLGNGGKMLYFGDVGPNCQVVVNYFARHGASECKDYESQADYILEVTNEASHKSDINWHEVWQSSPERREAMEAWDRIVNEYSSTPQLSDHQRNELSKKYASSYLTQFRWVYLRTLRCFWRDPIYALAKFFMQISLGLVIGFTYWSPAPNQTQVANGLFVSFFTVVFTSPILSVIQQKAIEGRTVYEASDGPSRTYSWVIMILTEAFVEIPFMWFQAAIMFVAIYFPTRADLSASHAGIFYLSQGVWLQTFVVSFSLMLYYYAPTFDIAVAVANNLNSILCSFCGVQQARNMMPGFWKFLNRVDPYTYYMENMQTSMMHNRPIRCFANEMAHFYPPQGKTCGDYMQQFVEANGGYVEDPNSTTQCAYCLFTKADEFLSTVGVSYNNVGRNVGFFAAYSSFNLLLALGLYWIFRVKKWPRMHRNNRDKPF